MKAKNRWNALRWTGVVVGFLVAVRGARATVAATGGDYTYDKMIAGSRYRIHVFTNVGPSTLTVTQGGEVEYLVVGGGGAAGYGSYGGGGGGGAVLSNVGEDGLILVPQTYSVTVGAGGLGESNRRGGAGSNSVFAAIEAPGGGGGGTTSRAVESMGTTGSSGGGGAGYHISSTLYGYKGVGMPGFGHDGGDGNWEEPTKSGGGGGGGSCSEGTAGRGGLGGGAPGRITAGLGAHGVPNTGGGGGGAIGSAFHLYGGSGASGIVVVRYLIKPDYSVLIMH